MRCLPAWSLVLLWAAPSVAQDSGVSLWRELIAPAADGFSMALDGAGLALAAGDVRGSIAQCETALAFSPDEPAAEACVLRALFASGDDAGVLARVARLREAGGAVATDPLVAHYEALSLARTGEIQAAVAALRTATRYRDEFANADILYGNLGELYAALDDHESAALFFRQALAADPHYAFARAGLAVALTRLGRTSDAESALLEVVLDDPDLGFMDEVGVFDLPDGEYDGWRALLLGAVNRHDEAAAALAAFESSPAGQGDDALIAAVRAQLAGPTSEIVRVEVPGCRPNNIALAPSGQRIAVVCEAGNLMEGALVGDRATLASVTGTQFEATGYTWGSAIGTYVLDIAYAGDGALRILYSDGNTEQIAVGGAAAERRFFNYGSMDVRPVSFAGSADRVLFAGQNTGGAQVGDWATTPVVTMLLPTSNGAWVSAARGAGAGRLMETFDGYAITVWQSDGAMWNVRASIPVLNGYSYGPQNALSADGTSAYLSQSSTLVEVLVSNQEPQRLLRLDTNPNPPEDTWASAITFVEALDGDRLVAGTQGWVHLIRLAR